MDRPKVSWQIKVKTYCVEISNWTCWKDSCVKSLFISTVWRDFSHELMIICNQISDYSLNYCHYFFILFYSTLRHAAAGFGTLSIPRGYYKKVWYWSAKELIMTGLFLHVVVQFSHELMIICNQISDYCLNYCHYFCILFTLSMLRRVSAHYLFLEDNIRKHGIDQFQPRNY